MKKCKRHKNGNATLQGCGTKLGVREKSFIREKDIFLAKVIEMNIRKKIISEPNPAHVMAAHLKLHPICMCNFHKKNKLIEFIRCRIKFVITLHLINHMSKIIYFMLRIKKHQSFPNQKTLPEEFVRNNLLCKNFEVSFPKVPLTICA